MKFRVGDTTYTGIKEKSLAWYSWKTIKAIGSFIATTLYVLSVLLVVAIMIALG